MKQKLCILMALATVLVSCNSTSETKTTNDALVEEQFISPNQNNSQQQNTSETLIEEQHLDLSKNSLGRQNLIDELKKLQQIVASNNKEKLASIFNFPLSDFGIYIDDNAYNEQFKLNGDKLTKPMFLRFYKEISENIWLDQLRNLFHNIDVSNLLRKDTLEFEAYMKTQPCYYSYRVELVNNNVMLRMNMNSNKNYKSKQLSEDDIPENSSEICEHSLWWIFRFDGNKLHLENISGAG